jgi:hypothetical protein
MSATSLAEFIYRAPGNRGAKDFSLHRERDCLTGLSFLDYDYGTQPVKFRVQTLLDAGYIVVKDGGTLARKLPFWGGELFEYYDDYVQLPDEHYTVYHPDEIVWTAWYQADLKNMNTPLVSEYLQSFYDLREK